MEIQYGPGTKHKNADALSRKPTRKCKNTTCIDCREESSAVFSDSVGSDQSVLNWQVQVGWHDRETQMTNPIAIPTSRDIGNSEKTSNWLPVWTKDSYSKCSRTILVSVLF